jgi:hypothetical protein
MITEKELIIAAKTFRANCIANSEKMSFEEACKIVLLSEMSERILNPVDMQRLINTIYHQRHWHRWWEFWKW